MVIIGDAKTQEVWVDNDLLDPKPSQKLRNHSPNGFAWGYSGSGPSQLALAILLQAGLPKADALRLYQQFKVDHIATLPMEEGFTLYLNLDDWLARQEHTPQGDGDSTDTD